MCNQIFLRRANATTAATSALSESNAIRVTFERSRFTRSPGSSARPPTSATRSSAIFRAPGQSSGATCRPHTCARHMPLT